MTTRYRTLIALGAAAAALSLAACGKSEAPAPEATSAAPEAQSTEWTQENPTDPAVPVDLPTTAVTNAPAEPATK